MKAKDIISILEKLAPLSLQEVYDNAGLITGNPNQEITGIIVTLDCTEEVVDEAIAAGLNMIIAHHPIVFQGLKKFNGNGYVERTIIKAIKNDVAIYAIHTNLDNVAEGVNSMICSKLELQNTKILSPKKGVLKKLVTFVPPEHLEKVRQALFVEGAGTIGNYDECSFISKGKGTYMPGDLANPYEGEKNKRSEADEIRVEVIMENHKEKAILNALQASHPYEEVAYYVTELSNYHQDTGSGMTGELASPMEPIEFLKYIKSRLVTNCVRYTKPISLKVQKVAVCGGAGQFLLKDAIRSGADVFISADFKYHQFFDAENRIMIADVGHYESEQFTRDLLYKILKENFPTFAVRLSEVNTNPVNYL